MRAVNITFQVTLHLNDTIQTVQWGNKQILGLALGSYEEFVCRESLLSWEGEFRVKIKWFQGNLDTHSFIEFKSWQTMTLRLNPSRYRFL